VLRGLRTMQGPAGRRLRKTNLTRLAVFSRLLSPPLRRAAAALWLAGAAIAGMTAVLAATHENASSPLIFATVAVALVVLAIATVRGSPWALAVTSVLLGAQLFGALGSSWELVHGPHGDKAEQLRNLGIDPTLGIALNLMYSLLASALFVWALAGARRRTPSTLPPDSRDSGAARA
jgi:hypothetical protein